MSFVSFLVLPRISQWTLMNLPLLSPHQKWKIIKFIEIEAQATCKSNKRSFLFLFSRKLEPKDFFWFKFIFHEAPVHDSTIWRNGIKVKLFISVWVPSDLPDRISMLLSSNCGLIDGFVMFISDVIDQDCSVIEPCSEQSRWWWMPVQAHDPCWKALIFILWVSNIFERPD